MWPDDARFTQDITTRRIYGTGAALNICRLLLAGAAHKIGASHASETQWLPDWNQLHVEHLLPQSWYEHWPLSDGSFVSSDESINLLLISEKNVDAATRLDLIEKREGLKNTLGNLTILNKEINMSIKNYSWGKKRVEIGQATQLRMNFNLVSEPVWDESKIRERGQSLAKLLTKMWISPSSKEVALSEENSSI